MSKRPPTARFAQASAVGFWRRKAPEQPAQSKDTNGNPTHRDQRAMLADDTLGARQPGWSFL